MRMTLALWPMISLTVNPVALQAVTVQRAQQ